MIPLALKLVRAGGARPGLLLVSSTIGMLLLLAALATPHAHDRQVKREAVRSDPTSYTGTAPHLLWQFDERLPIAGHQLLRASVAATGAGAPLPLGAARVPRPGEVFVSRALGKALRGPDGPLLRDALPGPADGMLSDAIVSRPNEFVYMVGYREAQLAPGGRFSRVRPVREFVPRDSSTGSAGAEGFAYEAGFAVVIAAALVTIALVVANASRVGARRRETSLSALRLAGAESGQIARLIAIEAAITALPGALIGAVIAVELRSAVESWPFGIWPVLSNDLTMPTWELVLAVAAMPAVAFASALLAMRGAASDPLGARQRTLTSRPPGAILLVPLVGWGLLLAASGVGDGLSQYGKELAAITGTCVAAVGMALCGPWLASRCGSLARRLARGPATLLGAGQLCAHPRTGFRAVASLILGLFVVSLSVTYFESHVAFAARAGAPPPTPGRVGAISIYSTRSPRTVDRKLEQALAAIPGVGAARLLGGQDQPSRRILVTIDKRAATISRIVAVTERASPSLEVSPASNYWLATGTYSSGIERTLLDDAQSLLWILDALAAASLAISAIDGIADRRRAFSALAAIGAPANALRRAVALELLVPFAVVAVTAVAFGVLVGITLVALTSHVSVHVPWRTLLDWLGIASIAAFVATLATATRVDAAIRPEHLRGE
jgi:hypothetical protein